MIKENQKVRIKESRYVPDFLKGKFGKVLRVDNNNIYIIVDNDIFKLNTEDINVITEKLYNWIDIRSFDGSVNKRRRIVKQYRLDKAVTKREFKKKYAKELQELNLKDLYIDFLV